MAFALADGTFKEKNHHGWYVPAVSYSLLSLDIGKFYAQEKIFPDDFSLMEVPPKTYLLSIIK